MYYLAKREYDYAIRICAYLAGSGDNAYFTITELSSVLLITKPFATKIIYKLKQSKIVHTTRGKKGGVSLAVNPAELSFYKILEAMGLVRSVSECINVEGFCPLPAPCNIHQFFIDHENELIEKLEKTTINNFAFSRDNIKLK